MGTDKGRPSTRVPLLVGKWVVSYHETQGDATATRYLHPDGWKRLAYYWEDQRAAEYAFYQYGQSHLPLTKNEIEQWQEDQEYWTRTLEETIQQSIDEAFQNTADDIIESNWNRAGTPPET